MLENPAHQGRLSRGHFRKTERDAVPAKDVLIATGSHNAPGLARLRAAANKFASGPNGLTTALFVYRDGKFGSRPIDAEPRL